MVSSSRSGISTVLGDLGGDVLDLAWRLECGEHFTELFLKEFTVESLGIQTVLA